jgi:outer membrane protein
MKKLIFILSFLFALTGINAQEITKNKPEQNYSFSLEQAIEYALQNNYSAINATRDIEISKQKKWETTASGLPQISGTVGYQKAFELQKSVVPAKFFDQNASVDDFAEVAFGAKQSMGASVTLSQLIFDGSYIVALQASKAYLQYYQNYKKKSDVEIREMITNSYGNVLLAEESIKILEKNKTVLEKNYNDINQIYKNGLGEEESVEQISITLASVKSSLNNIKRVRELSLKMLKINLGIDIEGNLNLTDNLDTLSKNNVALALDNAEFKVENSIDYQIASNFVTQKKLQLKLEKSKDLPSLAAAVNFGYNSFGNTFSFFNSDQRWFNYSNMGINLNVPIFTSFGSSARKQQAKIALEQAQTQQTDIAQKLKLQYQRAKSDFEFSIEEYATAKSNLNLAERIEKKQQIKFKEGLSTSFEFSEAQRQLYSTQQSYLQSMVDVINKRAALEKLTVKN